VKSSLSIHSNLAFTSLTFINQVVLFRLDFYRITYSPPPPLGALTLLRVKGCQSHQLLPMWIRRRQLHQLPLLRVRGCQLHHLIGGIVREIGFKPFPK
jgi:uncharacterized membrane protein